MRRRYNAFRRFVRHNRFVVAIFAAIVVASLFATISVAIYVRDGALLLDLSRPSYARVRQQIKKSDDTPAFSSSGKLDTSVVSEFRTQLNKAVDDINKLGSFDPAAIDDTALQLKP